MDWIVWLGGVNRRWGADFPVGVSRASKLPAAELLPKRRRLGAGDAAGWRPVLRTVERRSQSPDREMTGLEIIQIDVAIAPEVQAAG